jgi:hypothetical protein
MTMIARLAIRLSDVTPLVRRRIEIPLEVRSNQLHLAIWPRTARHIDHIRRTIGE